MSKNRRLLISAAVAVGALVLGACTEDIGTLGGTKSNGVAINSAATVVGLSNTTTGDVHGFLWNASSKAKTDLSTVAGGTRFVPAGINDAGIVVGVEALVAPQSPSNLQNVGQPYVWNSNTSVATALPLGDAAGANIAGIGNDGTIGGWITSFNRSDKEKAAGIKDNTKDANGNGLDKSGAQTTVTAVAWVGPSHKLVTIKTGAAPWVTAVASNGLVAGSYRDGAKSYAFVYNPVTDKVTASALTSNAYLKVTGVNAKGVVVAMADSPIVWDSASGKITPITNTLAVAGKVLVFAGINDSGLVGAMAIDGAAAFTYNVATGVYNNVGHLGGSGVIVNATNGAGDLVGQSSVTVGGPGHATIWHHDEQTPVPAPTAVNVRK